MAQTRQIDITLFWGYGNLFNNFICYKNNKDMMLSKPDSQYFL